MVVRLVRLGFRSGADILQDKFISSEQVTGKSKYKLEENMFIWILKDLYTSNGIALDGVCEIFFHLSFKRITLYQ